MMIPRPTLGLTPCLERGANLIDSCTHSHICLSAAFIFMLSFPSLGHHQENLKKLVDVSERSKRHLIPVQMVKDILSTTTQEVADDIIAQIPSGKRIHSIPSDIRSSCFS